MSFFISDAIAATQTAGGPQSNPMSSLLLLVGFILIFYFMLWRPQSKRAKDHRDLVDSLTQGDEVITNGGILGKIRKVKDTFIVLEVADGIELKVQKSAIASAVPKDTIKSI